MSVTSTSRVATECSERYRKQLASHFGNKVEMAEEPSGTVLKWGFGGTTDAHRRGRCPGHAGRRR
jgi:hypothetical protein